MRPTLSGHQKPPRITTSVSSVPLKWAITVVVAVSMLVTLAAEPCLAKSPLPAHAATAPAGAPNVSALELPNIFSDHMVLQAGVPVPVWGTAPLGHRSS